MYYVYSSYYMYVNTHWLPKYLVPCYSIRFVNMVVWSFPGAWELATQAYHINLGSDVIS